MIQCWFDAGAAGPALKQHWANHCCFVRCYTGNDISGTCYVFTGCHRSPLPPPDPTQPGQPLYSKQDMLTQCVFNAGHSSATPGQQ